MNNLVFDRTLEDVKTAIREIQAVQSGQTPSSAFMQGLKGCYNILDLNRVETAVNTVVNLLKIFGINLNLTIKTNWTHNDIFDLTQKQRYLSNISALRSAWKVYTDTPNAPTDYKHYTYANDIEKILFDIQEIYSFYVFNYVLDGRWHLNQKPFATYTGTKPIQNGS